MSSRFTMMSSIALGMLLGYVAASGDWKFELQAAPAVPGESAVATESKVELDTIADHASCCTKGLSRSDQLALAAHNDKVSVNAQKDGRKPNILVIWGDDIGWQNVSAYGLGTMGYTTPRIDSIGKEGIIFSDHYAQPSCTAGRAAFITGQYPIRSGMTTVGQPGDTLQRNSLPRSICTARA